MRQNVNRIKYFLVLLAFGLTVALFLWPRHNSQVMDISQRSQAIQNQADEPNVTDVGKTTMVAPRFTLQDKQKRIWELTAKSADQAGTVGQENITLDTVRITTDENGKPLTFAAQTGRYDSQNKQVKLEKDVVIEGYDMRIETEEVIGDIGNRRAYGDQPVSVTTERGTITGQRFNIENNGAKIRLEGGVKATFYPTQTAPKKQE